MFWVIGKEKDNQKQEDPQPSEPLITNQEHIIPELPITNREHIISSAQVQPSKSVTGTSFIPEGEVNIKNTFY